MRIEESIYDDNDNLTEKRVYDAKGNLTEKSIIDYDTKGNLTEKRVYIYDDKGNLTEQRVYDDKGNQINTPENNVETTDKIEILLNTILKEIQIIKDKLITLNI
jgi:hypothetical protein